MSTDILIVDDGPQWIALARDALRETGLAIRTAESVAVALELIQADPPAAIVLDLAIPSRDEGLAVLAAVKAAELPCKIIILSSTGDTQLLQRCWDMGAFAVVRKSRADIESDLPREVRDALGVADGEGQ